MKRTAIRSAIAASAIILLLSFKGKDCLCLSYKNVEKALAPIPAGELTRIEGHDTVADKSYKGGKVVKPRKQTVPIASFYMSKYEVTNGQYIEFITDLKQQGKLKEYQEALPDTLVWREQLSYNEPYVEYYFRHPAYRDYPVVGITREQAFMFCAWLTAKYMSDPGRKHKNVRFDLPTREQWEYAARGGLHESAFPWGGPYMQNNKGQYLANFKRINPGDIARGEEPGELKQVHSGDYLGIAGKLNDNADVTAPAKSYFPNKYGLYNMAGNVEELVRDKGIARGGSWADTGYYLRVDVEESYNDSNAASSERGFRFVMEIK